MVVLLSTSLLALVLASCCSVERAEGTEVAASSFSRRALQPPSSTSATNSPRRALQPPPSNETNAERLSRLEAELASLREKIRIDKENEKVEEEELEECWLVGREFLLGLLVYLLEELLLELE